jgi:dienelactone hydrolase
MRYYFAWVLLFLTFSTVAFSDASTEQKTMAKAFVAEIAAGQFEKAVEPFDQTMRQALPTEKLKPIWDGLIKKYGPLQRAEEIRAEKIQKFDVVYVTCEFERGRLDAKIVFTSDNKISGLFFTPAGKYQSPPYVDPTKFTEKEIQIGEGVWQLSGTLSIPQGKGPFPVVILVHGSGPQDRDETIGPNKPFRDLAQGLATRGIAALRYEKRTKQHQILMAAMAGSITVKEETIDDVVAAFKALGTEPKINSRRIFVLGHSLGGMLIPRIGKAEDRIFGFISLAGSTRPLEDLMLEQTKYILSLAGTPTKETQKQIEELEQQVALVKSPNLSADASQKLPLGAPAKYWLDLRGYAPAAEAKQLPQPMLILQGERDYQVTMEDFANWKNALGERKNATFIAYPKLNHLFMEGKGKSVPAEYATPGNVSQEAIEDIVKWIGGLNK